MRSHEVAVKRNYTILGILGVVAIVVGVAGLVVFLNQHLPIECNITWCVPKV